VKRSDLTPQILGLAAVAILALVAAIGWFAFVSPQRSKVDSLDQQIAEVQTSLTAAKAAPLPKKSAVKRSKQTPAQALVTALPADVQMPSLLHQVQHLAAESNVSLDAFTPSAPVAGVGYQAIPVSINVTGRYADIRRFLRQLRLQANVIQGRVRASGRLIGVETLGLSPGGKGLPELSAAIQLDAFTFQPTAATAPTTTTTTTDTATTAMAATP
jgi:hypothetical protein